MSDRPPPTNSPDATSSPSATSSPDATASPNAMTTATSSATPTASIVGLRHALVLALCANLPLAWAVTTAADARIDAFPRVAVLALTLLTTLVAGLATAAFPRPGLRQTTLRVTLLVLLAIGVRLTVPSPRVALDEVLERDAPLLSGTTLATFVLLLVAYVSSVTLAARLTDDTAPPPTVRLAHQDERQQLAIWWRFVAVFVLLYGLTPEVHTATASVVLVGSALVSLLTLADLRIRTPAVGSVRPAVVSAPRRIRVAAVGLVVAVTVALTAAIVPIVPVGWDVTLWTPAVLDADLPDFVPDGGVDTVDGPGRGEEALDDEPVPERGERSWSLPLPLWPLVALISLALLFALVRPHRWWAALQRLWQALRGSSWHAPDTTDGTPTDVADVDLGQRRRPATDRLRRVLDRIRPRPRDPRSSVLHEYLQVERLLAKEGSGRPRHETPHEHAVRVHVSAEHAELADLAADARFARAEPTDADVERARTLRHEIEDALRAART